MNKCKTRLSTLEKTLFVLAGVFLSFSVSSTSFDGNYSCHGVVGERALLDCYHENKQLIPLAKEKLPADQELMESYRCGTRLLHPGMTRHEVNTLCPASQKPAVVEHYLQSFEVHHRGYYGHHYVSVQTYEMEKWTFKQYGRFRTYVVFRDGIIYQLIQDRSVRN